MNVTKGCHVKNVQIESNELKFFLANNFRLRFDNQFLRKLEYFIHDSGITNFNFKFFYILILLAITLITI